MRISALLLASTVLLSACYGPNETNEPADKNERLLQASQSWPRDPDYSVKFIALKPLGEDENHDSTRPSFDDRDDYWGLPRTGEYELVAAYCAGCHSFEIVMQQRATRERWEYMLTWMSEKQGMVPLDADTEELVLDYLATNFGP